MFKFNPITAQLDLVNPSGVTSISSPVIDTTIPRFAGTSGNVIEDSLATIQDGGAVVAQAFVFNRRILNDVIVSDTYTMISTDIEIDTGDIILNGDGQLFLV